jgi:hypothetical protein
MACNLLLQVQQKVAMREANGGADGAAQTSLNSDNEPPNDRSLESLAAFLAD